MNPPFLSKSPDNREQDLSEAYKTMQKYRENLSTLNRIDYMLSLDKKMMLLDQIRTVDTWLKEKERIMTIEFEIHESDLIDITT